MYLISNLSPFLLNNLFNIETTSSLIKCGINGKSFNFVFVSVLIDWNSLITWVFEVFLDLAVKNNWILFFYHDPEVIAVTVGKKNDKYNVIDEYRKF